MKVNYQLILDKEINKLQQGAGLPRLLLHSCCAPCSSYVLEYLSQYFSITVYYYNPNIDTAEEYAKRAAELRRFVSELPVVNPITVEVGEYEPESFYEAAHGLEAEPEGGARCEACFRLRLGEAARKAVELGADYFTTTLSISPLKDAQLLNALGAEYSECYGVAYLHSDFKKRGGYHRSVELSAEYGLYRQNYCGCIFSKNNI